MAWCSLAAWTAVLWIASATGLDPTGLFSSAPSPGQSIDLLGALGLYNNTWVGVSLVPGPQSLRPAYYLQGDYRDLRLPPSAIQEIAKLLRRNSEFTIAAWLRQEAGNTGSIVSFSHGINRYLELQSSGRKNEIRLHYTSKVDSKVYTETFPYNLADNSWHHVALSVSGSQTELFVDCHPMYKRLLRPGVPDRNVSTAEHLWLGQRNKHYHFKGAMQDVRLIAGSHGYLSLCPSLDSTCPTCGQFSLLQSTVQELTRHITELSERLIAAEERISKVEDCDCQKSCRFNGTVHADGATWQQGCDLCACVHGVVQCHPVECPTPVCKHPVNISGECCQSCLRHCLFSGEFFDHGDIITRKKCLECFCQDGNMRCNKIDPETECPKLNCRPEDQFTVPEECCKFCPDTDECLEEGGLNGHHCHLNTKCVNTIGSYVCECLPGYKRVNKFNCAELDECSTGEHNCDVNADCINTQGSYHCLCKEGYTGDGYTCKPVCEQSCLNGGICATPGKCACPSGYTGKSCERDLDECATNSHRCTDSSVCVNMIGWYYCVCKPGYYSPVIDNNLGNLCQDIDECDKQQHTCHPSAQCVNLDGGFECQCPPNSRSCKHSCMFEDTEVEDGKSFSPPGKPCHRCSCNRGVLKCEEPKCNCSLPGARENNCCPQCDYSKACHHQELPDVILMHGERWSYQCQACECMNGEVDCWDIKCPPLPCDNPMQAPGDCCPHCNDLCTPGGNGTVAGAPCHFAGRMYESGAQFVNPSDPCAACNCKDGLLCCSYNFHCGDDALALGYDGSVATAPSLDRNVSSVSDVKNNHTKHSSGVRGTVYASDSAGSNKTEDTGN